MKCFNEPWMANINPCLLERFWVHKESKLPLLIQVYGAPVILFHTSMGVVRAIQPHSFIRSYGEVVGSLGELT